MRQGQAIWKHADSEHFAKTYAASRMQLFDRTVTKFTFSTQPHLDHRTYSHRFELTLLATRYRDPIRFNGFISCSNQHPQQGRMPTAKATSPSPIQHSDEGINTHSARSSPQRKLESPPIASARITASVNAVFSRLLVQSYVN